MRSWETRRSWEEQRSRETQATATSTGSHDNSRASALAMPILSPTSSAELSTCSATGGCFGLIATNTIGQGDTRSTGSLDLHARRHDLPVLDTRYKWPGLGGGRHQRRPRRQEARSRAIPARRPLGADHHRLSIPCRRTRRPGSFQANASEELSGEHRARSWASRSTTPTPRASPSPIAEMHAFAKDPRNAERIFPYIGGEEVNDGPPTPIIDTSSTSGR